MRRIPLLLALVTAALAAPRALARDAAAEVAARAAERGVPADALVAPVREAEARGLPPGLVADKVLEGLAKGVPPERVAAVATVLVERLSQAEGVLGQGRARGLAPPADRGVALADLAQALGAGVDRPALESLVAAAPVKGGRSDAVAAAALALAALARRGVPVADALPLGRALVRAPGLAGDVGAAFDAWRARGGQDPARFLTDAERSVSEGRPFEEAGRGNAGEEGRRDAMREERGRSMGEGRPHDRHR